MFCAQIQLLKVNSIIAFKREGASFPLQQIISLQVKVFMNLDNSGETSLGGLGYLQTMMVIFMVWTIW